MLLLFDVDGTLLRGATAAHRDALHQALHRIHGVDVSMVRQGVDAAGRTDGEIARLLLLQAGVSALAIDEHAEAVRDVCCQRFAELCPESLADKVLPGVADLLDWLSSREDARLALVTGNFQAVARLKLARAGLGGHFVRDRGGFGSDSEDRAALPGIARRRAGSEGVSYPRERTIVLGDTPRDIACAQADGVRCFAVATGPFDASALTDAEVVAEDAAGLRGALEAALSEASA